MFSINFHPLCICLFTSSCDDVYPMIKKEPHWKACQALTMQPPLSRLACVNVCVCWYFILKRCKSDWNCKSYFCLCCYCRLYGCRRCCYWCKTLCCLSFCSYNEQQLSHFVHNISGKRKAEILFAPKFLLQCRTHTFFCVCQSTQALFVYTFSTSCLSICPKKLAALSHRPHREISHAWLSIRLWIIQFWKTESFL